MPTISSRAPLKIAVLGAGKIGSTFAFQLVTVGHHDVTVIARPGSTRLQQLQRDNAIVNSNGERAPVTVCDALDEQILYDVVIVTLMDHQTDAVLTALKRSRALWIQFMFNTFHPDRLQASLGVERCAFGMQFVQATLDGEGKLKATIDSAGQKIIMDQQRWVDVFRDAGLPATIETQMPLWLRCHVPVCVAFESVSVAREHRGGGASWKESMKLARGVHASFNLIKAIGCDVYPKSKRALNGSPAWVFASVLWILSRNRSFRELLASGKAECQALVEEMAATAKVVQPDCVGAIQAMKPS
jgi:2-dehydropantoate 2-reductase